MKNESNLIMLSEEEYHECAKQLPNRNFLNSAYAGKRMEKNNWNVVYLGLKKDEQIVAATLLVSKSIHIGNYFYAPRGFLLDFDNVPLLEEFVAQLVSYMKMHKGVYFKVDPYVPFQVRDENGNPKTDQPANYNLINKMKELGFFHMGLHRGYDHTTQCRWISVLNLKDKTEDSVFRDFSYQTRQDIRGSQKNHVHVRALNYDELSIMVDMETQSSARQHFQPMSLSYYQDLFTLYGSACKALYAYLDLDEYESALMEKKQKTKEKMAAIQQQIEEKTSDKKAKQFKEEQIIFDSIIRKELEIKNMRKTYQKTVPLAAAFFIKYGNEVIYLDSGSSTEYQALKGSYAIQWHMIQEAIREQIPYYNFYGISGCFEKDEPGYGVFDFKRGFRAEVIELVGDFIYPVSKVKYKIYQMLKNIR